MKRTLLALSFVFLIALTITGQEASEPDVRIGLIADVQFADVKGEGRRKYRMSLRKLTDCVRKLNEQEVDLTVQLGDLIDRNVRNFNPVRSILNRLNNPLHHVLGNHDFAVKKSPGTVSDKLGLDERYYRVQVGDWLLIVLDGNDLSTFARPKSSDRYQRAENMRRSLKADGAPNAKPWNGGVGKTQLKWLRTTLKQADRRNQRVVVFCHYPVYPAGAHTLYNREEVIGLLEAYSAPVAYLSGHNHRGNYGRKNGVHYLTLKGMVDTDRNSFAIMDAYPDRLEIRGYGREKNRTLPVSDK